MTRVGWWVADQKNHFTNLLRSFPRLGATYLKSSHKLSEPFFTVVCYFRNYDCKFVPRMELLTVVQFNLELVENETLVAWCQVFWSKNISPIGI